MATARTVITVTVQIRTASSDTPITARVKIPRLPRILVRCIAMKPSTSPVAQTRHATIGPPTISARIPGFIGACMARNAGAEKKPINGDQRLKTAIHLAEVLCGGSGGAYVGTESG